MQGRDRRRQDEQQVPPGSATPAPPDQHNLCESGETNSSTWFRPRRPRAIGLHKEFFSEYILVGISIFHFTGHNDLCPFTKSRIDPTHLNREIGKSTQKPSRSISSHSASGVGDRRVQRRRRGGARWRHRRRVSRQPEPKVSEMGVLLIELGGWKVWMSA